MTARAQTVTILFTDLVGSTELLQSAGDERAQAIFKAHHRLLRQAVDAHGGHEVKWLGDGLMVAFDSASDAVRCAIAMQQAARRPAAGEQLDVRVGLNVGEAFVDESDYFGTPVVIARRLCDTCDAGQILASDLVVRLLDGRHDTTFDDQGDVALKGITSPVHAHAVRYEHDPLTLLAATPFVGRDDVLVTLLKRLDAARSRNGSLVMLVGEPGIGKTRTAAEFADQARASGATVLSGRCYDGEWAPPFSPFMEAIREHAVSAPLEQLRQELGVDAGVLARIVPMLRERVADIPEPPPVPAEGERYRLLEAAGAFFARLAEPRPLVLLLDDLHWADMGTIAMLQHVARLAPKLALVVVGGYRDVELDRTHPLADALQALRRETNYERIMLKGLQPVDVGSLLNMVAEQDVPSDFVQAINSETGGNPFFIREVMLHLVEEGTIVQQDGRWTGATAIADMRIPEGVREVIGRRLSRVSDACNRTLTTASALTAGFSFDVISGLVDMGETPLLDAIDEALAAQLIREPERGRYDFTHALIRHTLYEELNTPRRVVLHRRIAETLETLYRGDEETHLSELAYHFSEAGNVSKGVGYCRRAALRAVSFGAYEDAVALFARALTLNEDPSIRCELLFLLGRCQFYTGRMDTANLDVFVEAASIARELGDSHLLARAAICEGRYWPHGDERFTPLLKETLDALADEESPLRAMAMAMYATRVGFAMGLDDVLGYMDDAARLAERCGDPRATTLVHMYRFLLKNQIYEFLTPSIDGLEAARAMLPEAEASGDPELLRAARICLYWVLAQMGRFDEADEHMRVHVELTNASRIPADMHVTESCLASRALLRGDFAAVEANHESAMRFNELGVLSASPTFFAQLVIAQTLQGQFDEALSSLEAGALNSPLHNELGRSNQDLQRHALRIWLAAHSGDRPTAARLLSEFQPPRRVQLLPGYMTGLRIALPDACGFLDDRDNAAEAYERMLPWADQNIGLALYVPVGSASRGLGVLATVLEQYSDAERHFEDALAMNTSMDARPWVALTQLNYAQMLQKRAAPGDRQRASTLLDEALTLARDLGMAKVEADCTSLLTSLH